MSDDESTFWDRWGAKPARRTDGICPRCTERPRAAGDSYCTPCRRAYHRDYMRRTRKSYGEMSDEERRKARCRAYTRVLVQRGQLEKTPCACGSSDGLQARHTDYDDPRAVVWVCRACRR